MAQRSGTAGRLPAALLSLLLPGLALSCQSPGRSPAPGIGGLLDGPTRWLMLPEEQRHARQLTSTCEAAEAAARSAAEGSDGASAAARTRRAMAMVSSGVRAVRDWIGTSPPTA